MQAQSSNVSASWYIYTENFCFGKKYRSWEEKSATSVPVQNFSLDDICLLPGFTQDNLMWLSCILNTLPKKKGKFWINAHEKATFRVHNY